MAHPEQVRFIALVKEHLLKQAHPKKILEVGSYDVNGTIRSLFSDSETYLGADLIAGPGVDIAKSGHEIDLESDSLDLALSCECFEHNPYWFETFQNMIRMTKPGGLIAFTCASRGRVEHGTDRSGAELSPGTSSLGWNYYRNLRQSDFESRMDLADHFTIFMFYYMPTYADLYFFGFKKGGEQPELDLPAFESELARIQLMEKERFKHWGVLKHTMKRVYKMPLVAASLILDEKRFQEFALAYKKAGRTAMRFVGWKG
jgi:SAM-dependent methyltransferase